MADTRPDKTPRDLCLLLKPGTFNVFGTTETVAISISRFFYNLP